MKRSNTQAFFQDPDHQTYDHFLPVQSDFRKPKFDCAAFTTRLNELLSKEDFLVAEEDAFLHAAADFLSEVKLRFKNHQAAYDSLLNALSGSQMGDELYKQIATVLGDQPDLMDEFRRNCEIFSVNKEQEEEHNHASNNSNKGGPGVDSVLKKGLSLFANIKNKLNDSDEYMNFLRKVHEYNIGRIGIKDLFHSLDEYSCIMEQFGEFLIQCGNKEDISEKADHTRLTIEKNKVSSKRLKAEHKRMKTEKGKEDKKKHEDWHKPLRDLDFSNCEQATFSYWHFPRNFIVPNSSGRSELDAQVLNDEWISRDPGKKNYRIRHHNEYEKALNKCEDDRFEADVLLDRLKSTINRIEDLLKGDTFDIKHGLSTLQQTCVKKFCVGIDLGEKNSKVVLNSILNRLKLQLEETEKEYSRCNRIWVGVYEEYIPRLH
ncbi:paired amphipathic helix protein Sin3-like 4 [Mangifera indica]|uniref:paired amphipathic helix protein Sin3-like 4 n=1 Tax=Mangifera indica TaxID=29780 RepID=UPI001CFC1BB6|nr:paired amphipathic helix protein Sin3-like 4 [Mangifera indica]